jgi:hypothetical protein
MQIALLALVDDHQPARHGLGGWELVDRSEAKRAAFEIACCLWISQCLNLCVDSLGQGASSALETGTTGPA